MASANSPRYRRKRRRKAKRSDADYILSAQKFKTLVPSLRALAKRKRLTPIEKARITRKEKILKGVPDIFPVSKQQAKKLGDQVFATGVQGIQLRGVPRDAKIDFKGKDITVEHGGRKYLYWHLSRATVRSRIGMRNAGRRAFEQRFPIELVSELAETAFKQGGVVQINLWAQAGIVGDPHHTLSEFVQWVNAKWSAGRYVRTSIHGGDSDPGQWVNGIAILLEDKEYAARRKRLIAENAHVQRDLEAAGRAHRAREKKRLAAKGLGLDLQPLPTKGKSRAKRKVSSSPAKTKVARKRKKVSSKGTSKQSVRKARHRRKQ